MIHTRSLYQHHPKVKSFHPTHRQPVPYMWAILPPQSGSGPTHSDLLPHWIYCPFPRCPRRGDRQDNLKSRKTAHFRKMTLARSLHQHHPKGKLVHPTHPHTTCALHAGDISEIKTGSDISGPTYLIGSTGSSHVAHGGAITRTI